VSDALADLQKFEFVARERAHAAVTRMTEYALDAPLRRARDQKMGDGGGHVEVSVGY
jgi:hypothetical protein